jgi:hypothetical protein
MKTPVGDIFDKEAYSIAPIQIYEYVSGFVGLQKTKTIPANKYIGLFYSWFIESGFVDGKIVYLSFYPTYNDYLNYTNIFYIKYADYTKLKFNVATWTGQGIDFSAVSTYVQDLVKKWEIENKNTFNIGFDLKKYVPYVVISAIALIFLPPLLNKIK